MPDFKLDEVVDKLKGDITELAKGMFKKYRDDAIRDGHAMLLSMKNDLQRWTMLLQNGQITRQDFEWLASSHVASLEMTGLLEAGLAKIRAQQFRDSVFKLITDTIFSFL